MFDNPVIGLAVFDSHLRYQALNPSLAAMHGIPAESHLGKTLQEVLGDVASRVEPAVRQVLTTGRPVLNFEIDGTLPTRAGRRRWVDHLFPLRDSNGRVNRVGVVVVEVTARGMEVPFAPAGQKLKIPLSNEIFFAGR